MRAAGIDIGSNTSLLLIAEKTNEGFEALSDSLYFTRLAENIEQSQELSESALSRLDQAFAAMRKILDQYSVDKISIAATSAARRAKNKERLFELAAKRGLPPIEIISPKREAELTFIGALFGLGADFSNPLVVDIGGGSTELANLKKSISLDIGSVSLTERFLDSRAPAGVKERRVLNHYIQSQLDQLEGFLNEDHDLLVFTAGSPATLAFMEKQTSDSNKIHGLVLNENQASFWLEKLSALNLEERKKIPYLPEHRADVITAGLSILYEILKASGKKDFVVSAGGVRCGLILELFQKNL